MPGMSRSTLTRLLPALLLALTAAGCIDWKRTTAVPEDSVRRYISLVQTLDGTRTAVLVASAAPAAGTAAVIAAVFPSQVLRGGTVQTTLTSATPFSRAIFTVPGINDHWELTLASPVTSVSVLMVISVEIWVFRWVVSRMPVMRTSRVPRAEIGNGDLLLRQHI